MARNCAVCIVVCDDRLYKIPERYTVFHRINAEATILFKEHNLRLQLEGGH